MSSIHIIDGKEYECMDTIEEMRQFVKDHPEDFFHFDSLPRLNNDGLTIVSGDQVIVREDIGAVEDVSVTIALVEERDC